MPRFGRAPISRSAVETAGAPTRTKSVVPRGITVNPPTGTISGGSGVTLAGTTPTESSPYNFGNGKSGYFQSGSLQLVVIPEPATFGIVLSVLAAAIIRRRRFG
jgi:hypothetical protein